MTLVRTISQGNALDEYISPGLQVDDQVRTRNLLAERLVNPIVHIEFVTLQVDAGEEGILCERIVGDQVAALREDGRHGAVLLSITAEQEEDLGLEGVALAIAIKRRKKGVLLED